MKPQQSAIQMLNTLSAADFHSFDSRGKPSFLHFDNVVPFISSVLTTAEPWNRSEEQIVNTVEGIIQRSGFLMKEYRNLNGQFKPQWEKLSPLDRCAQVLETLANLAKEAYGTSSLPKFVPPSYSSTITGYARVNVIAPDDHKRTKRDRADPKVGGETIKTNSGQGEPFVSEDLFSIFYNYNHFPISGFFAEEISTQHEVHQYHLATLDLMEEVEIMCNSGIPELIRCRVCGFEYHEEARCTLKHAQPRKDKNPLALWKYAGVKDNEFRKNMLFYAETMVTSRFSMIGRGESFVTWWRQR